MNLHSDVNKVKIIVDRYLHYPVEGNPFIGHSGDCSIYAHLRRFCDCGLMHDFAFMDYNLTEILYENYGKDSHIHATGEDPPEITPEREADMAHNVALLERIFGKPEPPNLVDLKMEYNYIKKVLHKSELPETKVPEMYARLDKWFEKQFKEIDDQTSSKR